MLGEKTYTRDYIDCCRQKVESDIATFDGLKASSRDGAAAIETTFFNNMVLVLEQMFVHRLRTVEGKDGNAMNEVRVLATSLLENGGTLTPDKTIKLTADKSVLGIDYGARIALTRDTFQPLSEAFLDQIEAKFS